MEHTDNAPADPYADRHPSTRHLLSLFDYSHLPPHLALVSEGVAMVAYHMVDHLADGPELSVGLRHLVYGKDALVRQAVADHKAAEQ